MKEEALGDLTLGYFKHIRNRTLKKESIKLLILIFHCIQNLNFFTSHNYNQYQKSNNIMEKKTFVTSYYNSIICVS